MKRLFWLATAVALFAVPGAWAKEYTFGEVPPPSRFSAPVDYSRAGPAVPAVPIVPAVVPPKVTETSAPPKVVPLTTVAPVNVLPPQVTERMVAPPVATPKPVAENVEPAPPAVPRRVTTPAGTPEPLVVTPGGGISGKVILADARGRFVILNFPFGQMPQQNTALDVYRNGVKVGEIKITGPQRDDNTAADVVSGELQAGDVARNR